MCDKKKCDKGADDCDVKRYLENKEKRSMKAKKHLKTTVHKFVHKSMINIYAATTAKDTWNILHETNRYNIRYKVYINGKKKGGFVTLIDDNDHYGYHKLFYYNNGMFYNSIFWKTISDDAKIKLKRIKKSKLPM